MKKESIGTHVPASGVSTTDKINSVINYFLPEECRIRNRSDFYYVTAIAFVCGTLLFSPLIVGALVCVYKAKKCRKGGTE